MSATGPTAAEAAPLVPTRPIWALADRTAAEPTGPTP